MNSPADVIVLPEGGGALAGIGETFAPNLHTGTGNFSIPIALPPGRNGMQPSLRLAYSTGAGNGPFGLGWSVGGESISRRTCRGVPVYDEDLDVYAAAGDDLEPVRRVGAVTTYRPRNEGSFARIERHRGPSDSFWRVSTVDGTVSTYGTPGEFPNDSSVVADPADRRRVYEWRLSRSTDPFGNHVVYDYDRDSGHDGPHRWDQLYLNRIRYVDHGDDDNPAYLFSVEFVYDDRPDPFSTRRPGFEVRTRRRCRRIAVRSHAGADRLIRSYELEYLDQHPGADTPLNGVSLLSRVSVIGHDETRAGADGAEAMPPLEFGYSSFGPAARRFLPVRGAEIPVRALTSPTVALVDISGNGLPDLVELGAAARSWRNLGEGRFDVPKPMKDAPTLSLADPGVSFVDANGDGRTDLMVSGSPLAGYFPIRAGGGWDARSFRRFRRAPSFSLSDPEVRLVDLDGDGITDAIRSGTRVECYFNDRDEGWHRTRVIQGGDGAMLPSMSFADPAVHWADMTGDGLADVALIYDGNLRYWPSLGHGDFGPPVVTRNAPRLPYGHDPKRVLIADVDGDGLADVLYVGDDHVVLWVNRGGDAWSDPVTVRARGAAEDREYRGTPPLSSGVVRATDLLGTGMDGVLWSRDAHTGTSSSHYFLDLAGGRKPYLLEHIDNHAGARTNIEYAPSTRFFVEDDRHRRTRWRTTLPFPVHVVSRVTVQDHFSGGALTSSYRYRHGHWDGEDREFRGFASVEQRDAETFGGPVDPASHAPPVLTRTWFHPGPVENGQGGWDVPAFADEQWADDPSWLPPHALPAQVPTAEGRRIRRDALRALRGAVLRVERYVLDGTARQERPLDVTETRYGVDEIDPPDAGGPSRRHRIFLAHRLSGRTTRWERGDDPMTSVTFSSYLSEDGTLDPYGRARSETSIYCPRGWRSRIDRPAQPYLARHTRTEFAVPDDPAVYIHDRASATVSFEIVATANRTVDEVALSALGGPDLRLDGHGVIYYDGAAFIGLPRGHLGSHGSAVRTENLVFTDELLTEAYGATRPPYLTTVEPVPWTPDHPAEFRTSMPARAGYAYRSAGVDPLREPAGWYAMSSQACYDVQVGPGGQGRGLLRESRSALWHQDNPTGHSARYTYDEYDLMPVSITDAIGLTTSAAYDYRVAQPNLVTDSNGARTRCAFTPLGLVATVFRSGQTAAEGDHDRPSVLFEYAYDAYDASPPEARQPVCVRSIRYVHRDTDLAVPVPIRDETTTTVEYSDGLGRLLQTRSQSDDLRFGDPSFGSGPDVLAPDQAVGLGGDVVGRRAPPGSPYVVVSGSHVYDDKGRVVEAYEPFFSTGWGYAPPTADEAGEKMSTFYDGEGRPERTVHADGSEERIVRGVPGSRAIPDLSTPDVYEPTPWEKYSYDANDNAGRTHPAQDALLRHQHDTPGSIVVDARGRTVAAVVRYRPPPDGPADPLAPIEEQRTTTVFDGRDNAVEVRDPDGRLAFRHVHDLANRLLRSTAIDSGERATVYDAAGAVVEQRDGRGALILLGYDSIDRPVRTWARDHAGDTVRMVVRTEYGDGGTALQPTAVRAAARAAYQLGCMSRQWDGAGSVTFDRYAYTGDLVEKTRRVVAGSLLAGAQPFRPDWHDPALTPLDPDAFVTSSDHDALSRIRSLTLPAAVDGARRVITPVYGRGGALQRVTVRESAGAAAQPYVEHISYDARGRRRLVAYGNGVLSRYAYDERTGRLLRLRSEHYVRPSPDVFRPVGAVEQDTAYAHDPAGNLLRTSERRLGCGVPNTPAGRDAVDRSFAYDTLTRLVSATGRECDLPGAAPWNPDPRCVDVNKARAYTELYRFDVHGTLTELVHRSGASGFTRTFVSAPDGNRLSTMTSPGVFAYTHDANGNITGEGLSRFFDWDHADRMSGFRTQAPGGPASLVARYLHDPDGQRVVKVVRAGATVRTTVYVDGVFERHRTVSPAQTVVNDAVHVMDDRTRVARVRIGPPSPGDATPDVQYELSDHLGSSTVVLDHTGALVNREEYTPFGETSFGGYGLKRYRHAGKERDEESGLYDYGARMYAPWLGRWTSPDPAGGTDGLNMYAFVRNNPMRLSDPTGTQSADPPAGTDNISDAGAPEPEPHHEGADMIPGGAAPGPYGGEVYEYDPTTPEGQERIKGGDDFAQGIKAAVTKPLRPSTGIGLAKSVIKSPTGPLAVAGPFVGPALSDWLFENVEKQADTWEKENMPQTPPSEAGGAGEVVGDFLVTVATILIPGAAAKLARPAAVEVDLVARSREVHTSLADHMNPKALEKTTVAAGRATASNQTVIAVNNAKAYELLKNGTVELLPGEILAGPPTKLRTWLRGIWGFENMHAEDVLLRYFGKQGVRGGIMASSRPGCDKCQSMINGLNGMFKTDWVHLNPDPNAVIRGQWGFYAWHAKK